ncbi:MAG TPA: YetF domain-containing protein [Rhizomicrobium sp.]|nr:YetF domain-containing protein [Rhizomicrobium sp.]
MEAVFGTQHNVALGQECARAILIFFYGLALLRLSGRRTFADWSALDVVLSIIIGSSLSRALTGGAPLPGTLAACALLAALHVLLAHGVARSKKLSLLIEGKPIELGRDGAIDEDKRRRHMISDGDLMESLRKRGVEDLRKTARIVLEASGDITIVKSSDA